jgi:hypothetical protein
MSSTTITPLEQRQRPETSASYTSEQFEQEDYEEDF